MSLKLANMLPSFTPGFSRTVFRAVVVWFCVASASSWAHATSSEPAAAGFNALVIPTLQYAHEDIWSKTPNGRGPQFAAVDHVAYGQSLHFLVLVTNYTIDADQHAETSYDIAFIKPDGSAGKKLEKLPLFSRKKLNGTAGVQKAEQIVSLVFSPADPVGEWTVIVEAHDLVGRVDSRVEKKFTVAKAAAFDAALPSATDASKLLISYHRNPAPEKCFALLQTLTGELKKQTPQKRIADNGSCLGFFEQVLIDNPWLVPVAIDRLIYATGAERESLATVLAFTKRDDADFAATLSPSARSILASYQNLPWPVPGKEPLSGQQLDVLWGRFFASGRYQPIRDLVAILSYYPHREALENYKKSDRKSQTPPPEVLKSAVFGAAVWSLGSNIQQDKVVRDYCEGILLRKELPPTEHAFLAVIFNQAIEAMKKAPRINRRCPEKVNE